MATGVLASTCRTDEPDFSPLGEATMRPFLASALLIFTCSALSPLPAESGPDGVWTAFSPPRNRVSHVVVHDAPHDRIVMVGGVDIYTGTPMSGR